MPLEEYEALEAEEKRLTELNKAASGLVKTYNQGMTIFAKFFRAFYH